MAKSKLNLKMPSVSEEDAHKMVRRVYEVVKEFDGQFDELESAIGMYFLGQLVGWKVIVLIHNPRTIKKYERILKIEDIRKEFGETGPFTAKSVGYEIVQKADAFWKAVWGDIRVESRRELQKG